MEFSTRVLYAFYDSDANAGDTRPGAAGTQAVHFCEGPYLVPPCRPCLGDHRLCRPSAARLLAVPSLSGTPSSALEGCQKSSVESGFATARLLLRPPPPSNRTSGIIPMRRNSPKDFFLRRSRATTGQGHTQRFPAQQQQVVPPSAFRRPGMATLASA